jgi:predicted small lipoprotein YifL
MNFNLKHMRALFPLLLLVIPLAACGQKDSVEEFDESDKKNSTRSRLTDGRNSGSTQADCELPLDLATIIDPRRPGQTQTVLTTKLGPECINSTEVLVKIRSRSKVTLIGRFSCRSGQQLREQLCTAPVGEFLSPQKNTITIPVITDSSITNRELEATVSVYRSPF